MAIDRFFDPGFPERLKEMERNLPRHVATVRVSELPNFPVADYPAFQRAYQSGALSLKIQIETAWDVVWFAGGPRFKIWVKLLGSAPVLTVIAAIALAIVRGDWLMLVGAPLGYVAMLIANPYAPTARAVPVLLAASVVGLLAAMINGRFSLFCLLLLFLLPLLATRLFDLACRGTIANIALRSEIAFAAMYQTGVLGIASSSTQDSWWFPL